MVSVRTRRFHRKSAKTLRVDVCDAMSFVTITLNYNVSETFASTYTFHIQSHDRVFRVNLLLWPMLLLFDRYAFRYF